MFVYFYFIIFVWFLYISSICSYADNFLYLVVKNIPEKNGLERKVDIITNIVVHVIAIHWKRKGRVYLIVVSGLIWHAGSFCWHTTLTSCERRLLQRATVQLTLTSHYPPKLVLPSGMSAEEHTWTLLTFPKTHPGRGNCLLGGCAPLQCGTAALVWDIFIVDTLRW